MESLRGFRFGFGEQSRLVKKKRSNTFHRRPQIDLQPVSEYYDASSFSSTPPSNSVSRMSKDIIKNEDSGSGESDQALMSDSFWANSEPRQNRVDSKRCSKGVLAPAKWKDNGKRECSRGVSDGVGDENSKLKKVKLKVGGVTRTVHASSTLDGVPVGGSMKNSHISNDRGTQPKFLPKENSDEKCYGTLEKGTGLQEDLWRDFSSSSYSGGKEGCSRGWISERNSSMKQAGRFESIRKSKRNLKRHIIEDTMDDEIDEDDDEIQYLEKLKRSKGSSLRGGGGEGWEEEGNWKQQKLSRVLRRDTDGKRKVGVDYRLSRSGKDGKSRRGGVSEDTDYVEEEEAASGCEPKVKEKKSRKVAVDSFRDMKQEMAITTRQRALQSGKDVSSDVGACLIEFPDGLPLAPPKKQREKLSEVDQQLRKAEAAQRRRIQVEKAARESEAEAIRKILGQDSSRKKREEKIKKQKEELAQEKAATAMILASGSVRWVMGPSGTVVTFPTEMGLPTIFDSKPCSYPPPREKCAVPSCTNPYKYRDSKSKLPLCSLQCYKAIT